MTEKTPADKMPSDKTPSDTPIESTKKCRVAIILGISMLLLLLMIAAVGTYSYLQFDALAKEKQTEQANVDKLQQGLAHSQDVQYENQKNIQLQTDQISTMTKSLGYDATQWRLAESTYLLRLAHFNLTYQDNIDVALHLTEMANGLLEKIQQSSIQPIRDQVPLTRKSV